LHVGEAGRPEAGRKIFFDRKVGDRARKVRVRCAMSADERADLWQDVVEIQVIRGANDRGTRRREFENDESATGLENPMDFAECSVKVDDIANAERDDGA